MLLVKDSLFLLGGLLGDQDSPNAALLRLQLSQLDHGIPRSARFEFDAWVTRVRDGLGARRGDIALPTPDQLLAALAAAREQYRRYHAARDFAELDAAGVRLRWVGMLVLSSSCSASGTEACQPLTLRTRTTTW
jgi:hypothetical protein